ncbi:hypothetical protein WMY93_016854 [Mugilogobius chulae]|uniref:Uncharacterized protein n=1 Tax=Mugilogobius chulae TaxID=88201 RepID=A0AAW0NXJ3_9GOBI
MNLFCFTLEGSTESMYEPAYGQTVREVRPKFQCSPALLRRRPEWGGSDPSINCASKTAADTAESIKARRLKKLQNLMPTTKKGQLSASGKERSLSEDFDHLTDVLSTYNPVLTCIGLGKREKTSSVTLTSTQQSDSLSQEHSEVETVWSPLESPCELWSPQYQSCPEPAHIFRHELWECGSALSLPRSADWDRFENLIQEMDSKEPDPCLPHLVRSITDLDFHQDDWTRFGRFDAFRQQWPLTTKQDNGSACTQDFSAKLEYNIFSDVADGKRDPRCRLAASLPSVYLKALGLKGIRACVFVDSSVKQSVHRSELTKGHSNSMESLYSSGQSSSSGVTSGSNCSSNRASLRLDEELSSPRTFCGRARVHTEFVPSPYDTESLKLKVGDVIDIISKPAMGTWTGMLNNKIGYFKFIYVDILKEETMNEDSCVHELLRRYDLEEYALTLVLHGYVTAEDLVKLRENDLMELKVTDPEHRQRLLSAVSTLGPLHSDNEEAVYENIKNCPRDSGCGMASPDNASELLSPSEHTDQVTVC